MTENVEKVATENESTNAVVALTPEAVSTEDNGNAVEVASEETTDASDTSASDMASMTPSDVSIEDEEDGAALMESFMSDFKKPTDYKVGDKVKGAIASIDSQYVFLDLGGKSEASMPKELLADEEGNLPVVGDEIEAFVIKIEAGGLELGKHMPGGDDAMATIEDAFHNKLPVEGSVRGRNKGGLEVEIFGKRAFCPISQVELRFCESLDAHLGQTYTFRITELKDKGRNIVVSRRVLLEEENEAKAAEVREKIAPGAEFSGKVTSLTNYGAFVEIGAGIEGLVHVSEISHHRVQDPADVLTAGQSVRVLVQKYNADNGRISLSMKALEQDPWEVAAADFKVDTVTKGRVVRLQPFGAFVELTAGVDGLVHISEVSHRRINHPREVLNVGDEVEVKVINVDFDKRRIGLSIKDLDAAGVPAPVEGGLKEGTIVEAIVDKIEGFGVFMRLPEGKRGLLPNAEMNAPKGADMTKEFPLDSTVQVMVSRIDNTGRIRLSQKAIAKKKERDEYRDYMKSSKKGGEQPVFGTLGDLLQKFKK